MFTSKMPLGKNVLKFMKKRMKNNFSLVKAPLKKMVRIAFYEKDVVIISQ